MLTKKHFEMFAHLVREMHHGNGYDCAMRLHIRLEEILITLNPRFDKERFKEACFPKER